MLFICATEFTPEAAANVFNSIYQANVVHEVIVKKKITYVWILERIEIDSAVYEHYGIKVYNITNTTCRAKF
ncbi:MAG: hypothetical protein EBY32_20910 [Proteobacteria bacterium]|jgi:hypothetical protein|nr:hypothetical protein [Pseudomonadota bacterium]